jgi:hypothetical protein
MVDPDLEEHILDVMMVSPRDAASDNTIQEMLRREDREVSQQQIQQAASKLVDDGRLKVVGEKGSSKRYGLPDDAK